uniref:NADH-ubiquinone oxidoreductase chain 6 n=1 Tax=Bambusiphaga taibaishana TaxID=2008833 RepID=A0A7S4YYQ5_9HEMI|nr:NADH dehydrogenase subunit 6 [Bambusiphaga taibaishana]QBZ37975.1 NADH dehydrogenase subunit 6 [Bambusiphaga taibaishana]
MKYIMLLMLLNSIMSMSLNHPISLGSILMIQSMLTSMMMIFMCKNSWYSMILFITFSSGMMIMFMYMSSISSNEKFKINMKLMLILITLLTSIILMNIDLTLTMQFKPTEMILNFQENEEKMSILKNISFNKIYLTIMMTLIILMMLIAISNLINSFEGPLKLTYEND